MIDVTYIGRYPEVEVEITAGSFTKVKNGESVSVPDKLAKGDPDNDAGGLLDQPDNWAEAKKTPAPKADKP
jgi:hypothetical protein